MIGRTLSVTRGIRLWTWIFVVRARLRRLGGAGAVLNGGDFPAAHIVAGVPARTLRPVG